MTERLPGLLIYSRKTTKAIPNMLANGSRFKIAAGCVLLLAVLLLLIPLMKGGRFRNDLLYRNEPIANWFKRLPVTVLVPGVEVNATGFMNVTGQQYGDAMGDPSATEAFQFFGTNAVPFLIEKLGSQDSAIQVKATELAEKASVKSLPFRQADIERSQAVTALLNVKPFPAEAIPPLFSLTRNTNDAVAWAAFSVLKRVAPQEAQKVKRWR
jgi:hypothetical protein